MFSQNTDGFWKEMNKEREEAELVKPCEMCASSTYTVETTEGVILRCCSRCVWCKSITKGEAIDILHPIVARTHNIQRPNKKNDKIFKHTRKYGW